MNEFAYGSLEDGIREGFERAVELAGSEPDLRHHTRCYWLREEIERAARLDPSQGVLTKVRTGYRRCWISCQGSRSLCSSTNKTFSGCCCRGGPHYEFDTGPRGCRVGGSGRGLTSAHCTTQRCSSS